LIDDKNSFTSALDSAWEEPFSIGAVCTPFYFSRFALRLSTILPLLFVEYFG
jgi:hypothetical protein